MEDRREGQSLERFPPAWHTAVEASDHNDTFSLWETVPRRGG